MRRCQNCKKDFVDKDFIEVGIDEDWKYKPPILSSISILVLIFGLIFFIASIYMNDWKDFGSYFILLVGSINAAIDIFGYKKRLKEYEEELQKSVKRLSNPHYVLFIDKLGYQKVPYNMKRNAMEKIKQETTGACEKYS